MKTLTIKQPWAGLIISGIKDIENRTWKTKFRGRVLIHTGFKEVKNWVNIQSVNKYYTDLASYAGFSTSEIRKALVDNCKVNSAIIGSIEIVDCVINHPSIWAEKTDMLADEPITYNWVLKNPILFETPILNVKGKLSFFIPQISE